MPSKTPSITIGAAVYAVVSLLTTFLTINATGTGGQFASGTIGCLIGLIAPVVAVWHYTSTHQLTIPAAQGAGVGALSALAGAALAGLIQFGLQAIGVLPSTAEIIERQREQMIASGQVTAEQYDQMMSGMGGLASNPLLGLVVGIVIATILGAIAGAIAAAIFKKGTDEMAL